jgi:hypothetical protein
MRMASEVVAIALRRHLRQRQPGVARLGLVAEQHPAVALDRVEQWAQSRIVDQHRGASPVAQPQAEVLPDLHALGAKRPGVLQMRPRGRRPARRFETGQREGRDPRDFAGVRLRQRHRVALLLFDGREIGVVDVDGQQLEAVPPGQRHEARQGAVQMHVGVDLRHAGEVGHRVADRLAGLHRTRQEPSQQ